MDDITPDLLDIDELESEETLFRELRITADKGQAPVRIDKFLVDHVAHTSRNKIQQAADAGSISVNGKVVKSNYKVKPLDEIVITYDTPRMTIPLSLRIYRSMWCMRMMTLW